jgi:ATP-binding protein involved in chromosome partitioning
MSPPTEIRKTAVWNVEPLPFVRKIIAVGSGKGGVGKSTITVNLAHALAARGLIVGVLDADIYGPSIPRMLGLDHRLKPEFTDGQMIPPIMHGVRAMSLALLTGDQATVMRAPMVTKALNQLLRQTRWGDASRTLDVLLIDTPPGTGDVHLSLAQSVPLDGVVIVTTPQEIAVADAEKSAVMFQKMNVPIIGIIENMSYFIDAAGNRNELFGNGGGAKMAAQFSAPLLGQIPLDPDLRSSADAGESFFARHAGADAAKQLALIALSVVDR